MMPKLSSPSVKIRTASSPRPILAIVSLALTLTGIYSQAQAVDPLPAIPPNVSVSANAPLILLNMSRDHQLFYRAYNEFTDIDGDGVAETSYKHSITYGGYFDPYKCYTYSTSDTRFNPTSVNTTRYCSGSSAEWSGNFLNWVTMTRMDLVRQVLYGGYRSVDDPNLTVLERVHMVDDAHSFAKYFTTSAAEMRKLTPTNQTEITLCSTGRPTSGTSPNDWSQTQNNPPVFRFAKGNHTLWAANERKQCSWSEDDNRTNGNIPAATGFPATGSNPSRSSYGLGDFTYVVRVKVCDSALLGTEKCQAYGSSLKPVGLLHEYGETEQAEFGLITGSYTNNIQGGVLRRNITSFKSEINTSTGQFNAGVKGIVYTLNKLRLYGWRHSDGTYWASPASGGTYFCDYQTIGLTNGRCQSWGNPMGEMFLEGLRYFGGKTATSNFNYTEAGSPDLALGLTKESWIDPYLRSNNTEKATIEAKFGKAQCRKSNIINFNASVTSYDGDDLGGFSDLDSSKTVAGLINIIGTAEGVHGNAWSVGNNTVSGTTNTCDAKTVSSLGDVRGLCPDGPGYKGSYSLSGMAYWAHVNPVRTDYSSFGLTASTAPKDAFKINTYSVALSPAKPVINITTASGKKITITPSYRLNKGGSIGSGTLVDFREISRTATSGKYLINWEDSEQGADFDMDSLGLLTWTLSGDNLDVQTQIVGAASANGQGFGYAITGVKNRIGGQNADGIHFHSGIYNFSYTDPKPIEVSKTDGTAHTQINVSGGCNNCNKADVASVAHYTVSGVPNFPALQDPLWYAAKWGGFKSNGTSSDTPNTTAKWDAKINATGAAGSDGIPDNYAVVYKPDELTKALRDALEDIKATSNNAPAVSSAQLTEGAFKYVASFDSNGGQGQLQAFKLSATGFSNTPTWKGEAKLAAATTRPVITSAPNLSGQPAGIPFDWASLSATQQSDLRAGTTDSVTQAQARMAWLRGANAGEGVSLRDRPDNSTLGSIVNATPWMQTEPTAAYIGAPFKDSSGLAYSDWRRSQLQRRQLVWAAANDGMLHAFDANDGTPALSYVPAPLFPKLRGLSLLNAPTFTAMVDGSPFVADVLAPQTTTSTHWRSYLFGSLGRGGKAIYALDVTDTSSVALTEARAADIFRWQFTDTDDSDLGYITADIGRNRSSRQAVNVVRLNDGKFAVIFGNGIKSSTGHAALFILYIDGPDGTGAWSGRYRKIVVDGTSTDNGLMQPNWVDTNNDGVTDAIYAGDLKGNMWKFDVSSSDPTQWKVAFENQPLYTAVDTDGTSRLPITTMPQFRFHPEGGVMVVFGTGQSLLSGDFPNPSRTQKIYGIWDRPTYGPTLVDLLSTHAKKGLPRLYSQLVARTLTRVSATEGYITGSAIDWDTKKGWYLPLPTSGEAVLSNPASVANLVAVFTVIPSTNASICSGTPPGYVTFLDPITGKLTVDVMGSTTSTVGGVTTTHMNASTQLSEGDQKVALAVDARTPTATNGIDANCTNGKQTCIALIGKESERTFKLTNSRTRIAWRELPTFTTTLP